MKKPSKKRKVRTKGYKRFRHEKGLGSFDGGIQPDFDELDLKGVNWPVASVGLILLSFVGYLFWILFKFTS